MTRTVLYGNAIFCSRELLKRGTLREEKWLEWFSRDLKLGVKEREGGIEGENFFGGLDASFQGSRKW